MSAEATSPADSAGQRRRRMVSPANMSIVYIYAIGFILFAIWIPDLWFDWTTHKTVLNISFAVRSIVALGLVVPLLAGTFDLSIAGSMNAAAITVAWLMVSMGWSPAPAILVALLVSLVIGLVNGFLVVWVRINSFIATLATGAAWSAYADWRSGGLQITGVPDGFKAVARRDLFWDIQLKVVYVAALAVVLWYVIEHTPIGRYLQATGDNPEAARLAGVQTDRYVFGSLMVSAVVAGFAGVVQTAAISGGNANVGDPFLLSAFAAAFLGSTQFKRRFNVWGTLVAIWVLLSGVKGIELAVQSFRWLNDLFFGVALIVAVGFASLLKRWRARQAALARTATALEAASSASGESHRQQS